MPRKKTKTAKKPARAKATLPQPRKLSLSWMRAKVALNRSLSPHRSFRMTHKHNKPRPSKLPSTWVLVKQSISLFKMAPKVFVGLTLLYLIMILLMIGSGTQQDYLGLKDAVSEVFGGKGVARIGMMFEALLGGALTPQMSELQQYTQFLLIFLTFLAFTWTARQVLAGNRPTIAQALYNSPMPLLSGGMLVFWLALQLLPAATGIYIFTIANNQSFFNYAGLALLLGCLTLLLVIFSLYLAINTLMSLVVVTLPGMYPSAALGSTKQLVIGRRLPVLIRIVGLALWALMLWAVVLVPFLLLDSLTNLDMLPFIPAAITILSGVTLLFVSLYLYRLYRSMLSE